MEMKKLTEDQLARATAAILKAGRHKVLLSGIFGTSTSTFGCALGQAARGNGAVFITQWVLDYFSDSDRKRMFALNDDLLNAGVPQEIVAEATAAMMTEIHRST